MIRRSAVMTGLMVVMLQVTVACARCDVNTPWNDWHAFQRDLISPDGRVIDYSDERDITTSEGQSYALFFALVDNDPVLFRRLLRWTERHLAQGDLSASLPAWLWGRTPQGDWGVLDTNTASDSNLWIAYTLLEAGRLWKEHSYTALGSLMLQRMARDEVSTLPGFGHVLLPGKRGFESPDGVRLNPSYWPPQVLARVARAIADPLWADLLDTSIELLVATAPQGLAPDWVYVHQGKVQLANNGRVGSYNAIRVYLWVGMLHPEAPGADRLVPHFRRGLAYLDVDGLPARQIDVIDGSASAPGPLGFSAAVLPLSRDSEFGERQRARLTTEAIGKAGYYSRVLSLFGTAWDQHRYAFDKHGKVKPAWKACR